MLRRRRKYFDGVPVHIVRYENASLALRFPHELRNRKGSRESIEGLLPQSMQVSQGVRDQAHQ